ADGGFHIQDFAFDSVGLVSDAQSEAGSDFFNAVGSDPAIPSSTSVSGNSSFTTSAAAGDSFHIQVAGSSDTLSVTSDETQWVRASSTMSGSDLWSNGINPDLFY